MPPRIFRAAFIVGAAALLVLPLLLFSDPLLSLAASRLTGISVRVSGTRLAGLGRLSFKNVSVGGGQAEVWFTANGGEANLLFHGSSPAVEACLLDGNLRPEFLKHLLGSAPEEFLRDPILVERAVFEVGPSSLRLRSFLSKELTARGNFQWKARRLDAAELQLGLSEEMLRRIPEKWVERLPRDGRGRRILKCTLKEHELTLFGRNGPLLRASWEMV